MAIQGINNNAVSPFDEQLAVSRANSASAAPTPVATAASSAPASVDVSVEISAQAQQLAQDSLQLQSVAQPTDTQAAADAVSASQFGANSTINNVSIAAEATANASETLNATPSNSSQSASVASQYNVSPDTALGQTINFSA
ncbi:hypothetical protein [Marinomonas ostreistagni]|uniref:hypothetical protein n=1 Tax=Marinomonas ostreistagni TaxID=359209 RepID=UPI0019510DE5|nr:hypothetical protein [Marinomonas ostreistagni]MBM6550521.1 hypothetical protein [Marinomonas ostreistagni]